MIIFLRYRENEENMEFDQIALTLRQNSTPCAALPPNGMFHFINVLQAVLWLTSLTNSLI